MYAKGALQGFCYPSPRRASCAAYRGCVLCKQCKNYNQHNHDCIFCESRKWNFSPCGHDEEAARYLEQKLGIPVFDPDRKPGTVELTSVIAENNYAQDMLARLSTPIEPTYTGKVPKGFVPGAGKFK